MQRVLIIGCGGAGKSMLAREMGKRTGLPVVHLDQLFWRPGWNKAPPDEWRRGLTEALAGERWIIDGNYGGTMDVRLRASDTVVYLDFPRWVCLAGVTRRRIETMWRPRPGAPDGCRDRVTWEFVRWIWSYRRERRPRILERLQTLQPTQSVYVLQSRSSVRRFLDGLSGASSGTVV